MKLFIFIVGIFFLISCDSAENFSFQSFIYFKGDTLRITRYDSAIPMSVYADGMIMQAQGCAIYRDYLYRFYDGGFCKVFNIKESGLVFQNEFKLGCYHYGNHANCAQIDNNSGLLYVSDFLQRRCYVEKLSVGKANSELVQEIEIAESEKLGNCHLNIICGDDGYLWAFGGPENGSGKLHFFKFNLPDIEERKKILTDHDLLDSWTIEDNISFQGGVVRYGYLFFLSGHMESNKKILIFNTNTHALDYIIDLNKVVYEEPEDIDFYDKKMIITVNLGESYYVIDMHKYY